MEGFKEKFDKVLVDRLNVSYELIKPESKFIGDLGADSLDVAELIVEFEKQFNVSISDEEAENFQTVRDAENYLRSKLGKRERRSDKSIL
ncbi:MAG: acyl carrier protein [Flammeovirgaceae bacterium]|nr:acyl carrier protein [Flammeovirgaceae bacterium]